MKRQQWFRAVAFGSSLALLAAACGDDSDDDPGDDEAATAEDLDLEDCPGFDDEPNPGEPAEADGFDGETITVGVLSPGEGSGTVGQFVGVPLTSGNKAYFDYYNETNGGIAGQYRVEMDVVDSKYDPDVALNEYPTMADDLVMFTQILGTAVVDSLLEDLADDCMLAAPASLDDKWVLEPNLLPIGAPYQMQVINGLDWYYNELGSEGDVLCVAAQDDEYGDAGLEGARFAAENLGVDIATEPRFEAPTDDRGPVAWEPIVADLRNNNCDVVFWAAVATDTNNFADAITEADGFEPIIIGQSPGWISLFADIGNEYLFENAYFIVEGGQWGDESIENMDLAVELLEDYAPADQDPDIYFSFGTYQAMAVVQLLEKAVELGDLSRAGIMRALNEVGTLTFYDLYGDYPHGAPADRVPPRKNSISKPNRDVGGEAGNGLEVLERDYEAGYINDFEITAR